MKTSMVFFAVLILSGFATLAYAHPDPVGVTVQTQNDIVLYTDKLGSIVNDEPKNVKLFTSEWFYHNFTLILASVIVAIMIPVGVMTYKEDIKLLISN